MPRSSCPHCHATIAWYDLVPLFSWLALRGKCRTCTHTISWLYPFIELLTALALTALYAAVPALYFPAYFIFFSALIVTIRTDIETMLIARSMTLNLIPLGMAASFFGLLPISLLESILGTLLSYALLWTIARVFYWCTRKQGMGEGDLWLLAYIGAYVGVMGSWMALFIGSATGSIFGILYLAITGKARTTRIPFGPFLALGALAFVLAHADLLPLLTAIKP